MHVTSLSSVVIGSNTVFRIPYLLPIEPRSLQVSHSGTTTNTSLNLDVIAADCVVSVNDGVHASLAHPTDIRLKSRI